MRQTTTTIIPYLVVNNASEAIEFYRRAFGASVGPVAKMPDGKVMNAQLSIEGAQFFLMDEMPDYGAVGPLARGGASVTMHLSVPDCDAVFQRAADAGCKVEMPLQDMFWGDRYGQLTDPYGHHWSVATTLRTVSPEEIQKAMAAMAEGNCPG